MRKRQRREPPQLPAEQPVPETLETAEAPETAYSLDDIMNEFGGWSRPASKEPPKAQEQPSEPASPPAAPEVPPAPAQAPPAMEQPLEAPPEQPAPAETPPAPETTPAPAAQEQPPEQPAPARQTPRFQFVQMNFDADGRAQSVQLNEPAGLPPAEAPVIQPAEERPAPPPRQSVTPPEPVRPAEPPRSSRPREPKEVYQHLNKSFKSLRMRMRLCTIWAALAVILTILCHWEIPVGGFLLPTIPTGRLLIGLMFAGILTAWDVMFDGLYHLLQLHVDLDTLMTFCAVVFTVDGFARTTDGSRLPYAAVLLCAFCFAMWGRVLKNRAQRRSLKVALSLPEKPMAIVRSERAWGSRDCIFRSRGEPERFLEDLDVPSIVDRVMSIYAPAVIVLSLVLSLLMYFLQDRSFLMCWSLMLAGSIPMAAFVTWWRPFSSLAVRLAGSTSKPGAALCGWRGVEELYAPCCLAAADSDLFPKGNIKINGIKVFGGRSIAQLSGYVYTLVAQAGSGLMSVFQEVYLNQNGIPCKTDSFRRYEGGGVEGNIQGDRVLVGSITFMRAMRVRMEEGTNLRQAVYCAVNNELAAVFALKYVPSPIVRNGLDIAFRAKRLTLLLATRDFILTPDVIHRKYKIPSAAMEFPSTEERARLSGPYAARGGVQTALLGRDSFYLLAETVAGAQSLCGGVRAGLIINLLGGCVGLLLAVILAWTGGFANASAANLMLFCLLWTLPSLVLSVAGGR